MSRAVGRHLSRTVIGTALRVALHDRDRARAERVLGEGFWSPVKRSARPVANLDAFRERRRRSADR